jgi:uncharacterized coiled-coil protein SlyX
MCSDDQIAKLREDIDILTQRVTALEEKLGTSPEEVQEKVSFEEHLEKLKEEIGRTVFSYHRGGKPKALARVIDLIPNMSTLVERAQVVSRLRREEKKLLSEFQKFYEGSEGLLQEIRALVEQAPRDLYEKTRIEADTFLTKHGVWGSCMGTVYQIEYLFGERNDYNSGLLLGVPRGAMEMVTFFRTVLIVINGLGNKSATPVLA